MEEEQTSKSHSDKLGEWHATAICGNDITSSCLYVTALALLWAGPLAPISLMLVALLLWIFRGIYSEVVGALPLNGGAYNALLNTTSKFRASIAACLTILSYLATAVISGSEAIHYASDALDKIGAIHLHNGQIVILTICLLGLFAFLTIRGIQESAHVALIIFVFHLSTITLLVIFSVIYVLNNGTDLFTVNIAATPPSESSHPLLFGFAVALLGISGFESSANFVEEQKRGVFPKTLRNMWIAVTTINLSICLLALCVVPFQEIADNTMTLLAHMGNTAAGPWLSLLISIDAAIVLSGAVLTSFVSVTGLVHRMSIDRCLPQLLLKTGKNKTYYRIILSFFILSSLLIYITSDVSTLAGVYTISFLSVMALFAIGNMLLKIRRDKLPRDVRVSWPTLIIAITAVSVGLIGNVIIDVKNAEIFLLYFVPAILIVTVMLERSIILKAGIYFIRSINSSIAEINTDLTNYMEKKLEEINSQAMVFFTRGDNIANLNNAMLYVRDNEHTNKIKIVTVVQDPSEVPVTLEKDLKFLDQAYPSIDIEFVVQKGKFGPKLLKQLSKEWDIPLNFMFIGSPGDRFPHRLSDLGGVRLII